MVVRFGRTACHGSPVDRPAPLAGPTGRGTRRCRSLCRCFWLHLALSLSDALAKTTSLPVGIRGETSVLAPAASGAETGALRDGAADGTGEDPAWLSMLVSWQERLGQLQDRRQWLRRLRGETGRGQQRRALKQRSAANYCNWIAIRRSWSAFAWHCCRAGSKHPLQKKRGHWPLFIGTVREGRITSRACPAGHLPLGLEDPEILPPGPPLPAPCLPDMPKRILRGARLATITVSFCLPDLPGCRRT